MYFLPNKMLISHYLDIGAERELSFPDLLLQDGLEGPFGGDVTVVGDVNQYVDGHLVLARQVPLAADVVLEGAFAERSPS